MPTSLPAVQLMDGLGHAPPSVIRMTVAEAYLRAMTEAGADRLFNMPGRGVYPMLNQLPKFPELEYVTNLHEFPLAAMADGYARVRGRAAFLSLYMSTGVLNGSSAIFVAQRDRVPMVVTATQSESWAVGADHRAEISDIVSAVRPFTKWAWMPPTPDRVPEALRRAHAIATMAPCGPTFVAVPVDYWDVEIDYPVLPRTALAEVQVDPDSPSIRDAADLILGSRSPCLVVGYEAVMAGVAGHYQELARLLGCALVAEPDPAMLPSSVGFEYFAGTLPEASDLVAQSDVMLHVGVNTYEAVHRRILGAGTPKAHVWIGTSAQEVNKVVAADLAILGPLGPSARALVENLKARAAATALPDVSRRAQATRDQIALDRAPLLESNEKGWDDAPMSVARVCAELRAALPEKTVLVEHATTATLLVRENFPLPRAEQYVSASGSCQGWGLGAAVGVQLADLDRPVVAIVGDGGFMFGVQAVWTAVQKNVPLLVVVLDNGGWSSMRGSVARGAPAVLEAGTDLNFGWEADYGQIAQGMGCAAVTVEDPEQLQVALRERLPLTAPLLITARVRREAKTSRSPFVGY